MQSELGAAREDLNRLRYQLNRAEARIAKLEQEESRKREREQKHGEDMVEPDWNNPGYAGYQLEVLEKQRAELEAVIQKKHAEIKILRRQRHGAAFKEEEVALDGGIREERRAIVKLEEDRETINRRIAQLKRRLDRINARLPPYEQMNNLYV